jgi:multicomponent Na+:H+ antiporter subunit D
MIALTIAIPLVFAFASIPHKKLGNYFLPFVTLFNILLLMYVKPTQVIEIGGWPAAYGIVLVLDNVSYWFLLFVNLILLAVSLLSDLEEKYGTLLLVLTAALNGLILTGDLFNSFVFLEIIAAVSYIIASHKNNSYGAFKYLIFGSVGGTLYLLGAVLSYVEAGTLNMAYVGFIMDPVVVPTVSVFFLIALLIELKVLPLGFWAPDVYSNGSSITPVVLGSAVTVSIAYLFSRIFINVLGFSHSNLVSILAMISIIFAQLGALKQKNLGRALSYTAIAGVSVAVAALSMLDENVISAAYLYLFNDAIAKLILFSIYAYTGHKGFKENKTVGVAFTIASLSLIGFPMFAGFWAKLNLLRALFEIGNYSLPAVLLIATIIEAGYLIKWNVDLWYKKSSDEVQGQESDIPLAGKLVVLLLAMVLIIVGFLPHIVQDQTNIIASHIIDTKTYIDLILGGM